MKIKSILTSIFFTLLSVHLMAVPARKGVYTYRQPDGTTFQVTLSGDEFNRRVTTLDGCAVRKDPSGFYCYAAQDHLGRIISSGVRVNPANSTSAAAAASRLVRHQATKGRGDALRHQTEHIRASKAAPVTKGSVQKRKNIIILAQYQDLRFKYSRSNFISMLTAPGYSNNGATGSALDYFNDQFEGSYEFDFVISPIVELSHGYAYYGENDEYDQDGRAAELVKEACQLASRAGVDFSTADGDNDGEVDNVFIFVAGQSEAEGAGDDYMWPHHWYLADGAGVNFSLGGKKINSYAVATEITHDLYSWDTIFATIGTFCHEYSHSLGLDDMYDADYEDSGGQSNALWETTSLMDHGNYNNNGNTPPNFNAVELEIFGIGEKETLSEGPWSLKPTGTQKRYIRTDTDRRGEYFLFECRAAEGWDKYIGGSGMLIYHVDKSNSQAGYSEQYGEVLTAEERWWYNQVNCNPDHQCVDLVEAVPIAQSASQAFWPNGSHTAFAPNTKPAFTFWSGGTPDISIIDIRKTSDGVTFTAAGPLSIEKVEEFQDGSIILWTSMSGPEECILSLTAPDGKVQKYTVSPYTTGKYSYEFEGLQPKTTYKVSISVKGDETSSVSTEFTTKAYYNSGYPFIYLNSAERNKDGSFVLGSMMPLRVYNAKDAARISWQFNSSVLSSDGSGYYKVKGSGTIKAVIDYKDGTREIISKTITAK